MGELIELSYRRFPRQIIDVLIKAGYLVNKERHNPNAVERAWDNLRKGAKRTPAQPRQLAKE
jgi:hypothetical protein